MIIEMNIKKKTKSICFSIYSMLLTSSSNIENSSLLDEIMLSAASTSNQHQPNFWFPGSPLPSFFSSSSSSTTGTNEKISYIQQPTANKVLFDSSACSSSSGSSPPLSNDFLLTRSNPATTTLNLTQFNYIQQNHHPNPAIITPTSNNFLPRDDWSQIPIAQTTTSNTSAWHPQHTTKGRIFLLLIHTILLYTRRACSIPHS
jgi:hypothetical protein